MIGKKITNKYYLSSKEMGEMGRWQHQRGKGKGQRVKESSLFFPFPFSLFPFPYPKGFGQCPNFMTTQTLGLEQNLYDYLLSISLREPEILTQLRQETAQYPVGRMQIAPEQGQFIALLVQLLAAKKTLDIGVFTGYSSLVVALALPNDGKVVACEISEEFTAIARRYWQQAGVANKIQLHIAPALHTLDWLLATGEAETFDFAFIDADKSNYDGYYERSLQLVRPGGLIAIDNVLWSGRVANPDVQDNRTKRIRAFNQKLHQDERVSLSVIAIGDGLTLALKK